MPRIVSLVLIGSLVTMLAACTRPGPHDSKLAVRDALKKTLNLGELDETRLAGICSQKILIVFVGNAESLGPLAFVKGRRGWFAEKMVAAWRLLEKGREDHYYTFVTEQAERLAAALSSEETACAPYRKANGNVTLLTLVDGPSASDRPEANTTIMSWHFGHSRDGKTLDPQSPWQTFGPNFWTVKNGQLEPAHAPMSKPIQWDETTERYETVKSSIEARQADRPKNLEVMVPDAVDWIMAQADTFDRDYFADPREYTQTTIFLKSHGANLEYKLELSIPPVEHIPSLSLHPSNANATLFDSYGPTGSVWPKDGEVATWNDLRRGDFFAPLWSPPTLCNLLSYFTPSWLDFRSAEWIANCRKKIENDPSERLARGEIYAAADGERRQGPPDHPEQGGPDRAEQGGPDRAEQSVSGALGMQGVDSLSLSESLWRGATQGGKGLVYESAVLDDPSMIQSSISVREWHRALPEAYRVIGRGKKFFHRVFDPKKALNVRLGTQKPSLVLFDTCSTAISSAFFDAKTRKLVDPTLVPIFPKTGSDVIGVATFFNPMAVRIDALKYGLLTGFQYAYLAEEVSAWPRSEKGWQIADEMEGHIIDTDEQSALSLKLFDHHFRCRRGAPFCDSIGTTTTNSYWERTYLSLFATHRELNELKKAKPPLNHYRVSSLWVTSTNIVHNLKMVAAMDVDQDFWPEALEAYDWLERFFLRAMHSLVELAFQRVDAARLPPELAEDAAKAVGDQAMVRSLAELERFILAAYDVIVMPNVDVKLKRIMTQPSLIALATLDLENSLRIRKYQNLKRRHGLPIDAYYQPSQVDLTPEKAHQMLEQTFAYLAKLTPEAAAWRRDERTGTDILRNIGVWLAKGDLDNALGWTRALSDRLKNLPKKP